MWTISYRCWLNRGQIEFKLFKANWFVNSSETQSSKINHSISLQTKALSLSTVPCACDPGHYKYVSGLCLGFTTALPIPMY